MTVELTAVPTRDVALWKPELKWETREDGSTLIWREDALGSYARTTTEKIFHYAEATPEHPAFAERDAEGEWVKLSYKDLAAQIQSLAQFFLDLKLSEERPVLILSGNSIEHAVVALAAQHVGIPSSAIAPAYTLLSEDGGKLKDIIRQVSPGLIFMDDAWAYARGYDLAIPRDTPALAVKGDVVGVNVTFFEDAVQTDISEDVAAANAAITGDTIAKFLFTSGTTGSPKAVIQTHGMLCSNQEMVADCFAFLRETPPVIVDWAPWNHTAAGSKVFNIAHFNGGTYYIDHGKPSPKGIAETIKNLKELSPTWYFNVPAGYEMLAMAMDEDKELRDSFFKDLNLLMYAGAGMAQHTWDNLMKHSAEATGEQVILCTGLGATETSPFSLQCVEPQKSAGNVGIPVQGVTLKLVPNGGKLELRLKGPNVTPGYWRNEKVTAEAFDDEGFYMMGDAVRYAVEGDPTKGFFFDGRTAENFKLQTGTWVAVGPLRAKTVDALGGIVRDVVVCGENEKYLTALGVPQPDVLREILGDDAKGLSEKEMVNHEKIRAVLSERLAEFAKAQTGSATRIKAMMLLEDPLDFDKGEVTDKGSVNQRAVVRERADLVKALYADDPRVVSV